MENVVKLYQLLIKINFKFQMILQLDNLHVIRKRIQLAPEQAIFFCWKK